ncbi:glyoxylate reductase [Trifolium repens]|nr:glyoxylate reductase [Trifolium repens]
MITLVESHNVYVRLSRYRRVDLTVWNRTKSKCEPLISLGAKYQPSPEEVAASCDLTFTMLADPQKCGVYISVDVACGKHGAANGMGSGKGYVDLSTVDVDTSKLINGQVKSTGALFLEFQVPKSQQKMDLLGQF